jgi:hypothetical protein
MAKQTIQLGTVANDGTGDPLRTAFTKTNENFTELYTSVAALQSSDADLTAIAALTGTSGFLKKTSANNWTLDTSTYLTAITSNQIITALGYTPYNGVANSSSFLTGITSAQIISALGYTPYSAANPTGYVTSVQAAVADQTGNSGKFLTTNGTSTSWASVTTGTVTSLSVVSANGFAGTVATSTSTPAITLTTSVTGVLKGNGTAISAATAGTDYIAPYGSTTANYVLASPDGSSGTPTFRALVAADIPTLNQNTTGSAATLTTARSINGVSFNGSADITVTAAAGTVTGTTLNSTVVSSSLTSVGTIATGTWNGTVVDGQYGGTGVANTGKTITLGGSFTHTGAHTLGLTTSANTSVTLPTTGTLATIAGTETFTNKTLTSPTLTAPVLGTPASGNFSSGTFTWPTFNQNTSGTAAGLSATLVATSGGTGQSSYSVGDILYASTTTALSKLTAGTSGYVLTSGGAGVAPSWAAVSSGSVSVGSITGLGTGVATFLGTPSSANLVAALTDETGTGALLFGTGPTMTLPIVNNIKQGYTTTATAAGTTSLSVNSNRVQFFTGTTTQTLQLPAPQTMTLGMEFLLVNNSTGNVSVIASNSASVATVLPGTVISCISIDTTAGNGAAGWNVETVGFTSVTGTGSVVLSASPTFTGTVTGTAATATASSTASSLGYLGIPQSGTATTATLAIGDAGKHIYVTTNGQTITIPANASVAYPIGTTIGFIAGASATTVTIAITSDTMYLAGAGTTGSRTLAAHGMATAVKVAATTWYISGNGLT